jgi:predicted DNA-binding transcriptional regulator YafY
MHKLPLLIFIVIFPFFASFTSSYSYSVKRQEIEAILCKAIEQKKLVKFFYDNKYSSLTDWRVVEPYLVGNHVTTGNLTLVGWFLPTPQQTANGQKNGWRNYLLDRIQNLQIIDTIFSASRSLYNPKDIRMKKIICNQL